MSQEPKSSPKRSAKAEATRAAILASARRAFAEHGYDGAGLRGIAEAAGVTAMMVNRYFESKEGLFGEVVTETMRDPAILSAENLAAKNRPRAFAEALVKVTSSDAPPLDGFLVLFRSTSSKVAANIARERIAMAHHQTTTGAINGEHAAERAALFLSLVAGVQMMRQMMEFAPLACADPDVLVTILTPVIAELLAQRPE